MPSPWKLRAALCALLWSAAALLSSCQKDPCEVDAGSQACLCFKNPSDGACVDAMGVAIFHHVRHFNATAGKVSACEGCHGVDPDKGYSTTRPGVDDHQPCKGCHAEAFKDVGRDAASVSTKKARRFCQTCHAEADAGVLVGPLNPYPSPRRERLALLVTTFSHSNHLGRGLACATCHAVEGPEAVEASLPRHEICAGCHATQERVPMAGCVGCHGDKPQEIRGLSFSKNKIRFSHGKHVVAGGMKCEVCHEGMTQSKTSSDHRLPPMSACASCHGDPAKVPEGSRLDDCGLCHVTPVDPSSLPSNHR